MRLIGLILLAAATASADYTVDWSTMDAGAGRGTAGTFAMESTLGQIDAITGTTGAHVLRGGYWALVEEPLPLLRIFVFKENLILAWPDPSPGFVLQASPELLPATWTEVAIAPQIINGEKQVTWGPPTGRRFFRLRHP